MERPLWRAGIAVGGRVVLPPGMVRAGGGEEGRGSEGPGRRCVGGGGYLWQSVVVTEWKTEVKVGV